MLIFKEGVFDMRKLTIVAVFYAVTLLLLCTASFAGTVQLPQSGQTRCYNTSGGEITCPGTGQDGAKRMGMPWPDPRFVVNGNCVADNLTSLMWVKSPGSTSMTWTGAVSLANGLDLCGYTDWRMPNINELKSLVHSGYNEELCGGSPCLFMKDWLNSKGFSNVTSYYYWSSTTYAEDTNSAWVVNMMYGSVNGGVKTTTYRVWPVRGGQ